MNTELQVLEKPALVEESDTEEKRTLQAGVSPITGHAPPLETRWKPGQTGNPRGRPSAGFSVIEWINVFQDYSRADINKVLADKKAPASKVIAARRVLSAMSRLMNASGMPVAAPDFDRIIDRTHGKALQPLELSQAPASSQAYDWSKLSVDELSTLKSILQKAAIVQAQPGTPAIQVSAIVSDSPQAT